MRKVLLAVFAASFLVLVFAATAFATQPDPNHLVPICHRTHSATHPYDLIKVDEASIDGNTGNDHGNGDHQTHNEGPVPNPPTEANFQAVKAAGDGWGDIIGDRYVNGDLGTWHVLNWDAAGQAVFYNGCNPVPATPPTTTPGTTTPPTTSPTTTSPPTTTPGTTSPPTTSPSTTPPPPTTGPGTPTTSPHGDRFTTTTFIPAKLAFTGASRTTMLTWLAVMFVATGAAFMVSGKLRRRHS